MSYLASHWPAAWVVLVIYAAVAGIHLTGLARLAAAEPASPGGPPTPTPAQARREALVFHGGLITVLLALATPVAYWSAVYVWVHSLQDLLLAVTAPALIVLGAPWAPLRAGLTRAGTRAHREPSAAAWLLRWPVGVTVAFCVVWLGWQVPVLYDATAAHAAVRYVQFACFLAAGMLLWLQLIGSRPMSPAALPLRRVALLVVVVIADTILGVVLVFGARVIYPSYLGSGHHTLSLLSDQQVAGAVLWMGLLPTFIIAGVALLNTWLVDEDTDDPSRDLERLTARANKGWPQGAGGSFSRSRPGYRRRTNY